MKYRNIVKHKTIHLLQAFSIAAGVLAPAAHSHADPQITDGVNQTSLNQVDHAQSCLTADQALNGDHTDATADRKMISAIAKTVVATPLGHMIISQNAKDNVIYCMVAPNKDDNFLGFYAPEDNVASIVKQDGMNDPTDYFTTAAEEFSHAYQTHTNPVMPELRDHSVQLYDTYTFYLGIEAQAKIWTAQIWHDHNKLNEVQIPQSPVYAGDVLSRAQACFTQYEDSNAPCLSDAFNAIFKDTNAYTFHYSERLIAEISDKNLLDDNNIRQGLDIPADIYRDTLGHIPSANGKTDFLSPRFTPDDVINVYTDTKPAREQFKAWQTAVMLKIADGDIRLNAEGKPESLAPATTAQTVKLGHFSR